MVFRFGMLWKEAMYCDCCQHGQYVKSYERCEAVESQRIPCKKNARIEPKIRMAVGVALEGMTA